MALGLGLHLLDQGAEPIKLRPNNTLIQTKSSGLPLLLSENCFTLTPKGTKRQ